MGAEGGTGPKDGSSHRASYVWGAPLVVVFGIWLWQVFSFGGYLPKQWLPGALAVGFFCLIVSLLVAYPRRPRQLSLVVLGLFGLYAVVVAVSVLWADSVTRVWFEAGRTFGFVALLALAMLYLTDPKARRLFRYFFMAAALGVLAVCVWRLWSVPDIAGLFVDNRLVYPVSYPNNAAALFLVFFWPLIWLAAGKEERAPIRGAALGLATGLLCLALMTQSRGAVWSLAISAVLMFIISPIRVRTLLYLLVPAMLMVYEFPTLNRYWLEGPESVGGALGARTIVVGALTAAFIGLILALLERWIKFGTRAKTTVGALALLAALGGAVYGSITVTAPYGGPVGWISHTWREFTDVAAPSPDLESGSRFATVSPSGRLDIWRVAWTEFTESPALGVGADNFVFGYNRLREFEQSRPQQAHSLGLQVLGETGLVGAVFAFGGMLLALGGLLWPRCVAGWLGARQTWLRRRAPKADRTRSEIERGEAEVEECRPRPPSRFCSPRWGDRSADYGWEMAIVGGVAYWLIHANVDWLWQMSGVAIPMLLLLAAGLAGVDARAGIMWPRWNRWLRISDTRAVAEQARHEAKERACADADAPDLLDTVRAADAPNLLDTTPAADLTGTSTNPAGGAGIDEGPNRFQPFFPTVRRAEHHLKRQEKRRKRWERRQRNAALLRPAGVLSHAFRTLLVAVSLGVIIVGGLSYLSIQYQNSALGLAHSDAARAAARAESARWFQPSDPSPHTTQAVIYTDAAYRAAASDQPDRAGAALDNLALSIGSFENAVTREPADWALHYRTGVAIVNLLLATAYATGHDPAIEHGELVPEVPALKDWSALLMDGRTLPEPGEAAGSLAVDDESRREAGYYRAKSPAELASLAEESLSAADERNPLAPQVDAALDLVRTLRESPAVADVAALP